MRNIFRIAVLGVVWLLASPSCSKKSSNKTATPPQSCQLVTINEQVGNTAYTTNLTYNDQGQRTDLQAVSIGSPTSNTVYSFSGNMVYVSFSTGGAIAGTDTVTLNSSGQMVTDVGTNLQLGFTITTTYTYSGDEVEKQISQDQNGNVTSTTFYNWSGGNMIQEIVPLNGGIIDTINFSYNNKPVQGGDYWDLANLEDYPVNLIKNTNMVTGISYKGTATNFTYQTDSTGKITGFTAPFGTSGLTQTYSYQWSCH